MNSCFIFFASNLWHNFCLPVKEEKRYNVLTTLRANILVSTSLQGIGKFIDTQPPKKSYNRITRKKKSGINIPSLLKLKI